MAFCLWNSPATAWAPSVTLSTTAFKPALVLVSAVLFLFWAMSELTLAEAWDRVWSIWKNVRNREWVEDRKKWKRDDLVILVVENRVSVFGVHVVGCSVRFCWFCSRPEEFCIGVLCEFSDQSTTWHIAAARRHPPCSFRDNHFSHHDEVKPN